MKRPRRPVKRRVASKRIDPRKERAELIKQARLRVRARIAAEKQQVEDFNAAFKSDHLHVDTRVIPKGMTYQWFTLSVLGQVVPDAIASARKGGWRPVPHRRHSKIFKGRNWRGKIVCDGLILMERKEALTREAILGQIQRAKDLDAQRRAMLQMDDRGRFGFIPIEQGEIIQEFQAHEGPPLEVTILVPVRVPRRWYNAAIHLNLTPEEYVRRRLLMERPVLGVPALADPVAYEPINIHFTPVYPKEV